MKKSAFAAAALIISAVLIGTPFSKNADVSGSAGFQGIISGAASKTANHSVSSGAASKTTNQSVSSEAMSMAAFRSAPSGALPVLRCKYYNEKDFMASVASADAAANAKTAVEMAKSGAATGTDGGKTSAVPSRSNTGNGGIVGGIVPHHLLAGKMIASFFRDLSEAAPHTIVILAPNHNRIGRIGLQISPFDWGTAFGMLKADRKLAENLTTGSPDAPSKDGPTNFAGASLMEKEHSVSALIPYIKYYMPEVKVVPVLLHGNYPAEAAEALGRRLAAECSDSGTVVIASVDFSHYLSAVEAGKMDENTLKAIQSANLEAIGRMGNDNLDSPPAIIALISAMTELKASTPKVAGHGNSSDITGSGADYTTSYFTMLYRRPPH